MKKVTGRPRGRPHKPVEVKPATPAAPASAGGEGQITLDQAARLIMVTPDWVLKLAKQGYFRKTSFGQYALVAVVQGYIKSLKEDLERGKKSSAENRVREVRAQEIEMRIAQKNRELIPLEEAEQAMDALCAMITAALAGLPARVTRDLQLRRVIEKEVDEVRSQTAAKLRASSSALREGRDVFDAGTEADAA